jgi:hypothetical protein
LKNVKISILLKKMTGFRIFSHKIPKVLKSFENFFKNTKNLWKFEKISSKIPKIMEI